MVNETAPVEPDDVDVDAEAPSTDFEDADEDEAEPVYSTDETSLDEARYNSRDCLSMCRIYPFLLEAVQRTQTVDVYLLDRALAHIALQMTRCGMPIDIEERARVGAHLRELRATALVELRKYVEGESRDAFILWATQYMAAKARLKDPKVGEMNDATGTVHSYESALLARMAIRKVEFEKVLAKKGVNYGAKIQQAALLRAAGVALMKLTPKTGLPKIDKETLEGTAYNPASKALLNFILTDTTIRNYIEGEQQTKKKKGKSIVVEADGRLHPDWSIHKITGRWGSSPNVQNWSKRAGGGAENLRRMVAAPPGYIFVGADQKQLEARLIAGCSQDPFLLNVFANNEDIHGAVAGAAFPTWPMLAKVYEEHKPLHKLARQRGFGCGASAEQPYCEHCKQRDKVRDLVKRLEYGAFYGGSAETLWTSVVKDFPDLKLALVQEFMHQIGVKMAGVTSWRERELAEALRTGEIRSPILGRREVFPMGRVEPTVIYNFKPQSGGADLWGLGAIEFAKRWDQAGDEARLFHNGHDSVLILTKEKHLAEVERDVHLCWERRWNNVDFLMDCKSGARWSEV
jgi:DNA polymerase I-like protein with 3'-5' exonuclease and polymerase domains